MYDLILFFVLLALGAMQKPGITSRYVNAKEL